MENLFLCITDGYYTIFLGKPCLFDTSNVFDIDNLCLVHKAPTQQKKFKKKKKKPTQQLLKEAITGEH
jgi:hypothetical protein